jgi:hypothetical protein
MIDYRGNVIDKEFNVVFRKTELTDQGDIPYPYQLDRYNFSPIMMIGDLDRDKRGKIIVPEKSLDDKIRDKQGRVINEAGYLINEEN